VSFTSKVNTKHVTSPIVNKKFKEILRNAIGKHLEPKSRIWALKWIRQG
jgi:hypothetical protein